MLPSLHAIASRLRFRQLALLVALDEHGSVHKASEYLGLTQPGLTKALHEVEVTFGMPLFVRSAKGIQANDLGRCVIRYARLARTDLDHLRDELAGVLNGTGGRIAVGAITGALHAVLIHALTELRSQQPTLSISVQEGTSLDLLEQVAQGRLDLALCRTTVAPMPSQFSYVPLCEEKVAIAAHPANPLILAKDLSWADLAASRWIFYPSNLPLYSLLESEFREAGLPMPRHPTETASSLATMLMLQEDPGLVALMSVDTMEFCETHGIARRLPLAIRSRHENYGIVTRRWTSPSPAVSLLIGSLHRVAQEQSHH